VLDLWFVRCYHICMDNKKTTRHFEITGLSPVLTRPLYGLIVLIAKSVLIGLAVILVTLALVLRASKSACKGIFDTMAPEPL